MACNRLGREWFPTQNQTKWGEIDPVSQEYIENWFADREIFSERKMERVFWMTYGINLQTYLNMLRIQAANDTFDPAVNKYLEALRNYTSEVTGEAKTSRSATTGGTVNKQQTHSAPDVLEIAKIVQHDEVNISDTTKFNDKERVVTRDGVRKMHRHGDGDLNYQADAQGSKEVVQSLQDIETVTMREGKEIIKDESMAANRGVQAQKAAPMTAINLRRRVDATGPDGSFDGAFGKIANGALGEQDWTSASQYGESAGESGTSGVRETSFEGDKRIEHVTAGPGNQQVHEFSRRQNTGIDITEEESYSGYGEREKVTGGESRNRHEDEHSERISDTRTQTYGPIVQEQTSSGTDESSGEDSKHQSTINEDWNRFTGRAGLTPQEAFATGLKYLADFPNAIYWFIERLESCFIGTLEEEDYYA